MKKDWKNTKSYNRRAQRKASLTWRSRESRNHHKTYDEVACVHSCIWLHSLPYTVTKHDNGAFDPGVSQTEL